MEADLEGVELFSCGSARRTKVARHERAHTGEKPYACSMSHKRFAHKNNARRHERTQLGT